MTIEEGSRLHVGTYARARGEGLHPLLNGSGGWSLGEAYRHAPNASFGAYSPRFGLHYLVDERDEGALLVLRREGTAWRALARAPTHGAAPCYVALSPDEGWIAVANYGSGSTALFRLDPQTGLPGDPAALHANQGHGPNDERQEGPHAHCAIFSRDGAWLYQTDLGADEILAFAFDREQGWRGEVGTAFAAPPGSGPRHLIFHPSLQIAFLISELASTLSVLEVGEGRLSLRETVSTLPDGFKGDSLGGHIAIDAAGERIFVTNRGHDSIAVFALDETGRPSLMHHTPSHGASPRFCLLLEDQRQLLVANEKGNSVAIFELAPDGRPTFRTAVPVPGPAFLFSTIE